MMETTVSSSPNNLFCLIRKEWVKQTPEECVRQKTLSSLLTLGYPASLIVVERKIAQLPHLVAQNQKLPNRRIDIVAYQAKGASPLLIVECKVKPISSAQLRQTLGYNFYIGAKALLLASTNEMQIVDCKGDVISCFRNIPSYQDLCSLFDGCIIKHNKN